MATSKQCFHCFTKCADDCDYDQQQPCTQCIDLQKRRPDKQIVCHLSTVDQDQYWSSRGEQPPQQQRNLDQMEDQMPMNNGYMGMGMGMGMGMPYYQNMNQCGFGMGGMGGMGSMPTFGMDQQRGFNFTNQFAMNPAMAQGMYTMMNPQAAPFQPQANQQQGTGPPKPLSQNPNTAKKRAKRVKAGVEKAAAREKEIAKKDQEIESLKSKIVAVERSTSRAHHDQKRTKRDQSVKASRQGSRRDVSADDQIRDLNLSLREAIMRRESSETKNEMLERENAMLHNQLNQQDRAPPPRPRTMRPPPRPRYNGPARGNYGAYGSHGPHGSYGGGAPYEDPSTYQTGGASGYEDRMDQDDPNVQGGDHEGWEGPGNGQPGGQQEFPPDLYGGPQDYQQDQYNEPPETDQNQGYEQPPDDRQQVSMPTPPVSSSPRPSVRWQGPPPPVGTPEYLLYATQVNEPDYPGTAASQSSLPHQPQPAVRQMTQRHQSQARQQRSHQAEQPATAASQNQSQQRDHGVDNDPAPQVGTPAYLAWMERRAT